MWKSSLRIIYLPIFLFGFNAVAVSMIAADLPALLLAPLLLLAVAVSFLFECLVPYADDWNRSHDDVGRDWLHAGVNEAANVASVLALPAVSALVPWEGIWPHDWPLWGQLFLAIVVADFGITMAHVFSHKVHRLWRFHAVHHSVKRMYGLNGLMKHPVHQAIEMLAGTAALVLAGLPQDVAFLLAFAIGIQLVLQHTNVDVRVGPLRHVLALSIVHRFHHLKWPEEGDVNFGLFTTIWDRWLGTYHFEPTRAFSSDDLGIGAQPDYPSRYLAQLAAPFRSSAVTGTISDPTP